MFGSVRGYSFFEIALWSRQIMEKAAAENEEERFVAQMVCNIMSLAASMTAIACSRFTEGKPSRKSSKDSPPSK